MAQIQFPPKRRVVNQPFPEPPSCDCVQGEIRRRQLANGVVIHVRQCLNCGGMRPVAKASLSTIQLGAPFVDLALRERWEEQQSEFWRRRSDAYKEERQVESDTWWRAYNAYLKTVEWAAKRAAVLDRAAGVCEGCRRQRPTQVHHLTYDHVGQELLFELVAVCNACHSILHPRGVTNGVPPLNTEDRYANH